MSEILFLSEAIAYNGKEMTKVEREIPLIPSHRTEETEPKPELSSLPSTEAKEDQPEKTESRPLIERGTPPLRRPEGGVQLLVWGLAERLVLADRKREALRNVLIENIKSGERLRLAILTLEATLQLLARKLYVLLFRFLLRGYGEAFESLIQGKLSSGREG